jgi:hypothetical protein
VLCNSQPTPKYENHRLRVLPVAKFLLLHTRFIEEFAIMRTNRTRGVGGYMRAIAAVMLGLYVFLAAMAALPALHEVFHHDSKAPGHHCAVTLLSQGQIETPIPPATVLLSHFCFCLPSQPDTLPIGKSSALLPPGRAPPHSSVG